MQPVNLIVSCTKRKRALVPESLRLRSLPADSLPRRLECWLHRLTTHEVAAHPATDLYAGDHWRVAQAIALEAATRDLDVRLWVCSAGYGLVRQSDLLKPYSATFAPHEPDSVAGSASSDSDGRAAREWWSGLATHFTAAGTPRSIAELAARDTRVPLVLVASERYLSAMILDILKAIQELRTEELFSVLSIGATHKPQLVNQLKNHLLPADARSEAVVGGTRAALNIRITRFLFRKLPKEALPSTSLLTSMLLKHAATLPALRRFDRRTLTDDGVRRFIQKERRGDATVSKTHLLARLRASGAACEQHRFSEIFEQTVRSLGDAT